MLHLLLATALAAPDSRALRGVGRRAADSAQVSAKLLDAPSQPHGHESFLVFASSQPGEHSLEDAAWCGGHGAFACALVNAIRGAGDADGDGLVDIGELVATVPGEVQALTGKRQLPRYAGNFDQTLRIASVDPRWFEERQSEALESVRRAAEPAREEAAATWAAIEALPDGETKAASVRAFIASAETLTVTVLVGGVLLTVALVQWEW